MKEKLLSAIENAISNMDKVEVRLSVNSIGWLASFVPDDLEVYEDVIIIHYGNDSITMGLYDVHYDEIEKEFYFEDQEVLIVIRF